LAAVERLAERDRLVRVGGAAMISGEGLRVLGVSAGGCRPTSSSALIGIGGMPGASGAEIMLGFSR